ncbi:metal-dependent hydrolase [Azospirillum sp. SYSU D00513]|uniref:metal-dependent hydrolase n=1 Tax=Azospirillum sp. SYSU D00513 TaxID=2812561 RepID=UPI001A95F2D1|nr:metal-dependent hydrolase [Azospirillum sp. SYSU D00513]
MMASSHIIVGAATWSYLSNRLGLPPFDAIAMGMAVLGALAPDIDHPKSTLGSRLKPVSVPVSWLFGHRGITHSLLAVAACVWVLAENPAYARWTIPFVVGYLTHLGGDLLSPGGLPLLYPLKRRRTFSLPIIKTGGFSEQLLVAVLCGWLISGIFGCDWRSVSTAELWRGAVAAVRQAEGVVFASAARQVAGPPPPPPKPKPPRRSAVS